MYDESFRVVAVSDGIREFFARWGDLRGEDDEPVPQAVTGFVRRLVAGREPDAVEPAGLLRPTLLVHVVQLRGGEKRAFVAAFQPFTVRDPVAAARRNFSLTARESEILELLLSGLGAAEQGERLGLSTMTVHAYFKRLRRKTGAATLSGMIATLLGWTSGSS